MWTKKSQAILEYAILVAIVMVALVAMQVVVKRGHQGRLKEASDRMAGGESYSLSGTTIAQDTAMLTDRTIHEETATGDGVANLLQIQQAGDRFGYDPNIIGTGQAVHSASAVTGGATTSRTMRRMDSAALEEYDIDNYEDSDFGELNPFWNNPNVVFIRGE